MQKRRQCPFINLFNVATKVRSRIPIINLELPFYIGRCGHGQNRVVSNVAPVSQSKEVTENDDSSKGRIVLLAITTSPMTQERDRVRLARLKSLERTDGARDLFSRASHTHSDE